MYPRLLASRKSIVKSVKRFFSNRAGNVGLITGLAAIPIVLSAGAAIDMVRANNERTVFKNALDGAALAVGSDTRAAYEPDATKRAAAETALNTVANTWLRQNYKSNNSTATARVKLKPDGNGLEVSGTLTFPTTIMKLAGVDSFDMDTKTELTFAPRPMEIVLVLDTTGSMVDLNKMVDLKKATYSFLRTLYQTDIQGTTPLTSTELSQITLKREYVRLAIVPFAGAVRLDPTTPNVLTWIDQNGTNPISTENFSNTSLSSGASALNNYKAWGVLNKSSTQKHAWNGCVEGRARSNSAATNYLMNDEAPGSGATLFPAYFMPDGASVNGASSKAYVDTAGKNKNRTFYEPYVNSYGSSVYVNSFDSYIPSYYDVTIPTQSNGRAYSGNNYPYTPLLASYPTSGATPWQDDFASSSFIRHLSVNPPTKGYDVSGLGYNATDTDRFKNTNKYFNAAPIGQEQLFDTYYPSTSSGPWDGCARNPIVPLTHDPSKINTALGLLEAYGSTNIMEGLAWGWRVISPTEPYSVVTNVPSVVSPNTSTNGNIAQYNDKRWSKTIILMSDGQNTSPLYGAYGMYNASTNNKYGSVMSSATSRAAKMDADTEALCTTIKTTPTDAPAIKIYTIAFQTSGTLLQKCASEPKSDYYKQATTANIAAVFDSIAKDVLSKNIYLSK